MARMFGLLPLVVEFHRVHAERERNIPILIQHTTAPLDALFGDAVPPR